MNISEAVKNIEKRFGKEAISGKQEGVQFVSSGSLSLDIALGGGWAKGRIAELFSWESGGKSTLAASLAVNVQKEGKTVVYVDAEHAVDMEYFEAIGIDSENNWIMCQPSDGEEGLEIVREFVKCEEIGLIVIDSVTALVPKAVLQGEAGDAKMGLQARLMSSMLPTMIKMARESGCIILFINQLREKIGVMYGSPETTTGGNALKFYASQRVKLTKGGTNKDGEESISNTVKAQVIKNKVAPPFKKAEFDIVFGEGIDRFTETLNIAVELEIVKKSGSWFNYGTVKLGQGMNNVKALLLDNTEVYQEIEDKVLINLGLKEV